jgi:hypothetical protein
MNACKDCCFWDPFDNDEHRGLCRRYPPHDVVYVQTATMGPEIESRTQSLFPDTSDADWCGEFRTALDLDATVKQSAP